MWDTCGLGDFLTGSAAPRACTLPFELWRVKATSAARSVEWEIARCRRLIGARSLRREDRDRSPQDELVQALGITILPRSQVLELAQELDAHVEEFHTRRIEDADPFSFVAADAFVLKVREGGRVVQVHDLVATGVNLRDTGRSSAFKSPPAKAGLAGWLAYFRDLTARGRSGQAGHRRRQRWSLPRWTRGPSQTISHS